mgnify:CR=1 FL=1
MPLYIATRTFDDDDAVNVGTGFQRPVGIGLERYRLAATYAFIRSDDDATVGIQDTVFDGFGRKAAENDRMNSADACAGEHGVGRFGHHRHIDAHTVSFPHAAGFEDIGKGAYFLVQLAVGDFLVFPWIVAFPNDRDLVATGF